MEPIRFTLLGPLRAWRGDEELPLGAKQQRLILALLLSRAGESVSLADLVEVVWGDRPPGSAVNVVHRYVGALRRLLEPELPRRAEGQWLTGSAGSYRMRVTADSLDLLAFRREVEKSRLSAESGQLEDALAQIGGALELWRDRCAAGLDAALSDHPWFVALENECTGVAREAARLALRLRQPAAVLPALRRSAARNPFDEGLQAQVMLLLAADGNQAEALTLYQTVTKSLDEQLGVGAGPEMRAALQSVLHSAGGAAAPAVTEPAARPEPEVTAGAIAANRVPALLPSDHPYFTGRQEALDELAGRARRRTGSLPLLGIDGIPGVGKTILAVHLAHLLAPDYPDGQLYVDLRGFDALRQPLDPAEALRVLMSAMGIIEGSDSDDLEARAALYRSVLAGRRMLVLLDNAYDADQVVPLLPGAPDCLVIVTSRSRLAPLDTTMGAFLLTLDVPGTEEARANFVNRIGPGRAETETAALDEIIERCGHLPLAMALVAARADDQPLPAIAAELRSARRSLDAFDDENLDNNLRGIFSWSYHRLTAAAAHLFRLLSAHPGPDITAESVAALADIPQVQARALLGELIRTRVVTQHRLYRYRLHVLVRTYAAELAAATDSRAEQTSAAHRLYGFYLEAAEAANRAVEGTTGSDAEVADAMMWFITEHEVLRSVVEDAAERGDSTTAWRLVSASQFFYHRYGWWSEWRDVAQTAVEAAERAGDPLGRAQMERSLAGALYFLGHHEESLVRLRTAQQLFEKAGLDPDRAQVLMNLTRVLLSEGRYAEAVRQHRRAILILRAHGLSRAEVAALQVVANHFVVERPRVAEALARRAADLCAAIGDTQGLAICDELLARCALAQGRAIEALNHSGRGIERLAGSHFRITQAEALTTQGDILATLGRAEAAREAWREALTYFDDPRVRYAVGLQERLRQSEPAWETD
ncbi:BTAD domain-containing putative transcriptional regulator [Actinoplanes sp. NPDC049596]|uniref:AfsR/SARP family transcriptional regulator n=1 Tax=unclassified Actinoplanes TaxID=2626549 RepID=UPI003431A230